MCQNEIRNYNNKMTNSQSSEWQKNQRKQKNFQCPCGKSYLSYPALYTHIKQAHNGKAPGQIKRPDTQTRGRPKATGNTKIQQHNKFIEQDLKKDPLPQLLKMIQGANVSTTRQVQQIYLNQPVFKLIMNDKDKPFNPKFLKQDRIYDVKMGQGIIQFFREIDQLIENKNVYDQIVMLIVLLTEHIIEETQDQNVLSLGTIGLMPEFVNYFIIHDFKKPVQRLKLENLWIFQNQNIIRVFNVFFKWMLYKKFTLTKVQINTKYLNPDQSEQQENDQKNFNFNASENKKESSESEQSIGEQQNKGNADQQNQFLNDKQQDHQDKQDKQQNEKFNDKPLQNPSDIS